MQVRSTNMGFAIMPNRLDARPLTATFPGQMAWFTTHMGCFFATLEKVRIARGAATCYSHVLAVMSSPEPKRSQTKNRR